MTAPSPFHLSERGYADILRRQRDEAEAEVERLRGALGECRSWCVAGANAIEPRNVFAQVIGTVDGALKDVP